MDQSKFRRTQEAINAAAEAASNLLLSKQNELDVDTTYEEEDISVDDIEKNKQMNFNDHSPLLHNPSSSSLRNRNPTSPPDSRPNFDDHPFNVSPIIARKSSTTKQAHQSSKQTHALSPKPVISTPELIERRSTLAPKIAHDPFLLSKLQYFELARNKRQIQNPKSFCSTLSAFKFLVGIRMDIKFAQKSAERRRNREQNVGILALHRKKTKDQEKRGLSLDSPPPQHPLEQTQPPDYDFEMESSFIFPTFSVVAFLAFSVLLLVSFAYNSWKMEVSERRERAKWPQTAHHRY